jgi:hypothetical protein
MWITSPRYRETFHNTSYGTDSFLCYPTFRQEFSTPKVRFSSHSPTARCDTNDGLLRNGDSHSLPLYTGSARDDLDTSIPGVKGTDFDKKPMFSPLKTDYTVHKVALPHRLW